MHVVATAGHVDHGKSALVRALTGIEPDRWEEERRRGMTIDLGFAWTTLPSGAPLAFVDVPGHERFLTNMLAGVGPVPAVLLVVAADEGWMPQTEEHVAALVALGVRHVVVAVSRADLADPAPAAGAVRAELARHGLAPRDVVPVSARTGAGLPALVAALERLAADLPAPDPGAPLRFWVDRVFTVGGAGTVVTGTLAGGTLAVGDALVVAGTGTEVAVRGLQTHHRGAPRVAPVARVAVNLRGVDRAALRRGDALITPGRWTLALDVDVLGVAGGAALDELPVELVTHIGSAAVPARLRRLGPGAARLRLAAALPLHLGDRLLLRDPAGRRLAGAVVADLAPPPLRRRGDAARIAATLAVPTTADEVVDRAGVVPDAALAALGPLPAPVRARHAGDTWVSAERWQRWCAQLAELAGTAGDTGMPVEAARRRLGAPRAQLVTALAAELPDVELAHGMLRRRGARTAVPAELRPVVDRLTADPFAAPEGAEVNALGRAAFTAGVRAGALLHLGGGVYVGPDALDRAVALLRTLPQPFTVSEARQRLGASRRVAVPLLEHLDAARRTRRDVDGRRVVVDIGR